MTLALQKLHQSLVCVQAGLQRAFCTLQQIAPEARYAQTVPCVHTSQPEKVRQYPWTPSGHCQQLTALDIKAVNSPAQSTDLALKLSSLSLLEDLRQRKRLTETA